MTDGATWEVKVLPYLDAEFDVFWVGISAEPKTEDITRMLEQFEHALCTHRTKLALHIQHVGEQDVKFLPDIFGWMPIVGWLFTHASLIEDKMQATVVQGQKLDDVVRQAMDLFYKFYKPKKPFWVIASPPERTHFTEYPTVQA